MIVTELMDGLPVDESVRKVQRDEKLFLTVPDPGPMKLWKNYSPLGAINLPFHHVPGGFMVPQGIFESEYIHIEYSRLGGRQPFYHRNTDADEIAYHVTGTREVITEIGTLDLSPGDFSRIPVGVSHDNHGFNDVHIIFYIPQGVVENIPAYKKSEHRIPPFPGWEPKPAIEFYTEHLGEVGSDSSVFYTDELMLLDNAKTDPEKILGIRGSGQEGVEWLYKSDNIWLGETTLTRADGTKYTRHRMADEIQIQVKGRRALITQRGTLELQPGDFVSIPQGCAFTSITDEANVFISCLMRYPAFAKKDYAKVARSSTAEVVAEMRLSQTKNQT